MNEQLSAISIKVVLNSSIFSDDYIRGVMRRENRGGPKTEPWGIPNFNLNKFETAEPILTA